MRARPFAVAVLLALPGLLSACGETTDDTVAGDLVQARTDDQFTDGEDASVTLPTGRLLVYSEEPVASASADETRAREAVDAPSGTVLVPITWQYDTWASTRLDGIMAPGSTPKIDLVSGENRYRLPPPQRDDQEGESFYVVVDGDGAERSLEIDFEGVVQTVDLASGLLDEGDAEALYDIEDTKLKRKSCDDEKWFDTDALAAEFTCTMVGPVLTPYAAGKWAPPGSVWLALTLETELRSFPDANGKGGTALYRARSVKVDAEIDDSDPIYEVSTETSDDVCPTQFERFCGYARHLVFQVPIDDPEQGPLDLKITYRLSLVNDWGDWSPPQRRSAKAKETFKIWKD